MVYNPFAGWPVTGTWLGHLSYSDGGTDYPLGYNTDLPAPAAGTLQNHGMVGSAGRRATLWLDTPVARQVAAETREGAGPMVGIVFQHAASYNAERHYSAGEIIGKSGASANGSDYGGDVHLHIHGVNAAGQRVDFTKFIDGTTTPNPTPTPTQEELDDMAANRDAAIVRDYETEKTTGKVRTALLYPGGQAVALTDKIDINSAVRAHVVIYGLSPTNTEFQDPRDRFGAQVTAAQWTAFWKSYPGTKTGDFS